MQWRIQELTEGECERGSGGLASQVYLQLVMQWQIQELTEGGAKGGSGGLAPQVYLHSLVMITNKKRNIKLHWLSTRKYCEAFNEMLRLMALH